MKNINPYPQPQFEEKFKLGSIYQELIKDFDHVTFEKYFDFTCTESKTPRENLGSRINVQTYFTAVPFYYLEFLLEKNPTQIYDLGCGWNIFKKYIPNIVGIGAENPTSLHYYADQHDHVDDGFIQGHRDHFESVFSINALHFFPLSRLQQRVSDFVSMIRPNGRGYLALNIARMLEKENTNMFSGFTIKNYEDYVNDQLSTLQLNYCVYDVEINERSFDEVMDGNIRLVIEK